MNNPSYRPLGRWQLKLHELSLQDSAKYIKLSIGLYLGYFVPVWLHYPELAISTACSTMLTMAVGTSNFAARSYFYQRVASNALFMPLGSLLVWFTQPHLWQAVILMPLLAFPLVSLRPHWFRLTSLSVPLAMVLYSGEHIGVIEERVFGVVIGMALGLVLQQLILPPDHGLQANRLLNKGNDTALKALAVIVSQGVHTLPLTACVKELKTIKAQLVMAHTAFEQDLHHSWLSTHLQRNRERTPLFIGYSRVFDVLHDLLTALLAYEREYWALGPTWQAQFHGCLQQLEQIHQAMSRDADPRQPQLPLLLPDWDALLHALSVLPHQSIYDSIFVSHCTEYTLALRSAVALHLTNEALFN